MTSGYLIVDLKGKDLDSPGITVKGLYEKLEAATKPIVIDGIFSTTYSINVDKPQYITLTTNSSKFVLYATAAARITVDDDDLVKAEAIV